MSPTLVSRMVDFSYTVVSRKSTHERSTLQACQRGGLGPLLSASAFNHERAPMYAYRDTLPTNSLVSQMMLLCVARSGSPYNVLHLSTKFEHTCENCEYFMCTKLDCSQVHNSAHHCTDKTKFVSMHLHILAERKSIMLSTLHPRLLRSFVSS